ncbi:MAG: AAA family ATPase, partial [Synergistes sp.]|nr:AAA family ATPase [Synergistes sp.]
MSLIKEKQLSADKLRRPANLEALGFKTTSGLEDISSLIGQDRAVRSIDFGISVDSKGFNILVLGEPGCGRTSYALKKMRSIAAEMPAPDDWVYVYNFEDPSKPLAINLPAGKGREL